MKLRELCEQYNIEYNSKNPKLSKNKLEQLVVLEQTSKQNYNDKNNRLKLESMWVDKYKKLNYTILNNENVLYSKNKYRKINVSSEKYDLVIKFLLDNNIEYEV